MIEKFSDLPVEVQYQMERISSLITASGPVEQPELAGYLGAAWSMGCDYGMGENA